MKQLIIYLRNLFVYYEHKLIIDVYNDPHDLFFYVFHEQPKLWWGNYDDMCNMVNLSKFLNYWSK